MYERAAREHGFPSHPLVGGWRALPYLYDESTCAPAREILARARAHAAGDSLAALRVEFFTDGLRHMELTREVVRLAYAQDGSTGTARTDFLQRIRALEQFRAVIGPRHVVWPDVLQRVLEQRRIRTTPDGYRPSELNVEGL